MYMGVMRILKREPFISHWGEEVSEKFEKSISIILRNEIEFTK